MVAAGCERALGTDEVVTEIMGASLGEEHQRDLNTSLSPLLGWWLENIFQQNWRSI